MRSQLIDVAGNQFCNNGLQQHGRPVRQSISVGRRPAEWGRHDQPGVPQQRIATEVRRQSHGPELLDAVDQQDLASTPRQTGIRAAAGAASRRGLPTQTAAGWSRNRRPAGGTARSSSKVVLPAPCGPQNRSAKNSTRANRVSSRAHVVRCNRYRTVKTRSTRAKGVCPAHVGSYECLRGAAFRHHPSVTRIGIRGVHPRENRVTPSLTGDRPTFPRGTPVARRAGVRQRRPLASARRMASLSRIGRRPTSRHAGNCEAPAVSGGLGKLRSGILKRVGRGTASPAPVSLRLAADFADGSGAGTECFPTSARCGAAGPQRRTESPQSSKEQPASPWGGDPGLGPNGRCLILGQPLAKRLLNLRAAFRKT